MNLLDDLRELGCPRTWAELILIGTAIGCGCLLMIGFGG